MSLKQKLSSTISPTIFFHHQSHHLYLFQGGKVDHCSNCHLSLKDSKYHILACSGCKGAVAGCHLNKSLIPLFFSFTSLTLILTLRANKVTNTNYTGKAKQRAEYCFSHWVIWVTVKKWVYQATYGSTPLCSPYAQPMGGSAPLCAASAPSLHWLTAPSRHLLRNPHHTQQSGAHVTHSCNS